jgi:hypothetical protein
MLGGDSESASRERSSSLLGIEFAANPNNARQKIVEKPTHAVRIITTTMSRFEQPRCLAKARKAALVWETIDVLPQTQVAGVLTTDCWNETMGLRTSLRKQIAMAF